MIFSQTLNWLYSKNFKKKIIKNKKSPKPIFSLHIHMPPFIARKKPWHANNQPIQVHPASAKPTLYRLCFFAPISARTAVASTQNNSQSCSVCTHSVFDLLSRTLCFCHAQPHALFRPGFTCSVSCAQPPFCTMFCSGLPLFSCRSTLILAHCSVLFLTTFLHHISGNSFVFKPLSSHKQHLQPLLPAAAN